MGEKGENEERNNGLQGRIDRTGSSSIRGLQHLHKLSRQYFQVDSPRAQSVTIPIILSDTDTDTFFRYQISSIPIPILFSGTKF